MDIGGTQNLFSGPRFRIVPEGECILMGWYRALLFLCFGGVGCTLWWRWHPYFIGVFYFTLLSLSNSFKINRMIMGDPTIRESW
jgi:hypothetical protein